MNRLGGPSVHPDVSAFGVSAADALRVRTMPDQRQTVRWDGLDVQLYATHLAPVGGQPHWIIVGEAMNTIPFAFRVDDDPAVAEQVPLDLLRRLADQFGLLIDAGPHSGSLIAMAAVPLALLRKEGGRYAFRVNIPAAEMGHMHRLIALSRLDETTQKMQVALFFYLNLTLYTPYVQGLTGR